MENVFWESSWQRLAVGMETPDALPPPEPFNNTHVTPTQNTVCFVQLHEWWIRYFPQATRDDFLCWYGVAVTHPGRSLCVCNGVAGFKWNSWITRGRSRQLNLWRLWKILKIMAHDLIWVNYREFSGGFDVLLKVIKLNFEDWKVVLWHLLTLNTYILSMNTSKILKHINCLSKIQFGIVSEVVLNEII